MPAQGQLRQPPPVPHIVHPGPVAAPEVHLPMVALGRMRVPQHAQLDRVVEVNGRTVTLREAVLEADPNERHQLRNGQVVTQQQIVDALDAWEKRANTRLAYLPPRSPVPQPTAARMAGTHQQLGADQLQRRDMASSGWQAIINRPPSAPRAFNPSAAQTPNGQPVLPKSTSGQFAVSARSPGPSRSRPATHPFDDHWSRQWGDPAAIAIDLSASAGHDFQYDDSGDGNTGCVGVVEVGGWLLGSRREIARAYAGAGASPRQVHGSASVYILGDAIPVWHEEGTFTFPNVERTLRTQPVTASVATIGPLDVDVSAMGTGTALIAGGIGSHINAGRDYGCDVTLTPEVQVTANATASVHPPEIVEGVLQAILGDVQASVVGKVMLLDLKLPARLGIDARSDGRGNLIGLDQNGSLAFTATMMKGRLAVVVDFDLPRLVALIFGIDRNLHHEWDLHDWAGESWSFDLAEAHNTIAFVQ